MIFRNTTRDVVIAEHGRIADTFFARFLGLMFRLRYSKGNGLLITPCDSIHMFFVFFPLDIVFVDRDKRVVRIRPSVPPFWFAMGGPEAHSVIELPAGTIEATGTKIGDQIDLVVRQ